MRISDWGSDVRSSDLYGQHGAAAHPADQPLAVAGRNPAEEQDIAVATRHYCGSGDPPHDQVPAAGQLGGDRIAREPRSADLAQAASSGAPPVRPAHIADDPADHAVDRKSTRLNSSH